MAEIIESQKEVDLGSGVKIDTEFVDGRLQLRIIGEYPAISDKTFIPAMTSDVSPSPFVATASSIYTSFDYPYRAFDGNLSTQWSSRYNPPGWIKIDIGQQKIVKKYAITGDNPSGWRLEASNDDIDWAILHTVTDAPPWNAGERREFFIQNDVPYRYYRLFITSTFAGYARLRELELFEDINRSIYANLGIFEYGPIDLGFYFREIKNIIVIKDIPLGADVKLYTSTSSDRINFSDWSPIDENGDITSPQGRFIKIKIELIGRTIENYSTIYTFNESDRMNFAENNYVEFDGQLKLRTVYDKPLELVEEMQDGRIYRIHINKNEYKKIKEFKYPSGKIDLSNGTGGTSGQSIYTAPNGVVVRSSAPVYSNSNLYYMKYLFDGKITQSNADGTTYWLTDSYGNQTLTFDFGALDGVLISQIKVWPRCRSDASSNYRILTSDDDVVYAEVVPWVTNTHNNSTPYETVRTHDVEISSRYVRFELTRNGSWGVCLSEIEFHQREVKCLINDNGTIKTYVSEDGWIDVGDAPVTKSMLDYYGMTINELNTLNSSDEHIIYELESDNFEIYLWTPINDIDFLRLTATPKPQLVISTSDISINYPIRNAVLTINKFANSLERIVISTNQGYSWKTYKDGKWKDIDIYNFKDVSNNGMTTEELNSLTKFEWDQLGNYKRIRFAFYLEQEDSTDLLSLDSLTLIQVPSVDTPKISSVKIIYNELDKKYSGLMFMDTSQQYYSTSFGEILKYLDFGTLIQGQTSLDAKVYVVNTLPFDVKNIRIYPQHNIDGLTVEISKSNMPFIAENELFYDQVLGFDEVIEFYVRLTTDKDKVGGGTFDIKVKADAV